MPTHTRIGLHDVAQIVVGACVLGFPFAVTEEVWHLSQSLQRTSMIPIVAWSVFFIGAFTTGAGASGHGDTSSCACWL